MLLMKMIKYQRIKTSLINKKIKKVKLQYKSYAKLNLFIRVLEKRPRWISQHQSIFEKNKFI